MRVTRHTIPRPQRHDPVPARPAPRPQVHNDSSFDAARARPRPDGTTLFERATRRTVTPAPHRATPAATTALAPKPQKSSFIGRLLGSVLGSLKNKVLGPPYPATAAARAKDGARIDAQFRPAISRLPAAQREVLDTLRRLGMDSTDLFRGSHAVIADRGRFYEAWRTLGAVARSSSHYPGVSGQQYELQLKGVGVLLFGRDRKGNTWCQLEAHSGAGFNLGHLVDYVKHKLSGNLNVGPAGTSPHSEKRGQELHLNG